MSDAKQMLSLSTLAAILTLSGCAGPNVRSGGQSSPWAGIDAADATAPGSRPRPDAGVQTYPAAPPPAVLPSRSLRADLDAVLGALRETGLDDTTREEIAAEVEGLVHTFQTDRHDWYQRALDRGRKYLPMIRILLREKHIPEEMAWLPLIESGFDYAATSPAGARGLWQFMSPTARDYGLEVSRRRDERLDPYAATLAAREYLLDRVAVYGADSFLLVAAAYNAGEARVSRALRRLDDPMARRTFVHVRHHLPSETRGYVPQLLAAAVIGRDPARYGFRTPTPGTYAYYQLRRPRPLGAVAAAAGTDVATLRRLNDDLPPRATRTPVSNYVLRVPGTATTLAADPDTIHWWPQPGRNKVPVLLAAADRVELQPAVAPAPAVGKPPVRADKPAARRAKASSPRRAAPSPAGKTIRYRVQSGNRLADLAEWFHTDADRIRAWNPRIRPNGWLLTGQVLKIHGLPADIRKTTHEVRSGESLWTIGGLYGVDVERLAGWNGLGGGTIHPGRKLVVYYKAGDRVVPPGEAARRLVYRVRAGNYLSGVADLFGVSVRQLKHWNGLASGRVYPGQKLVVYVPSKVEPARYRVRHGDTLSEIAERLGADMGGLRFINGIRNPSDIRTGQELRYYKGLG